ncbi:helix-turn-helix domain-containing protein [Leekyejoonella antrihumi]|uniref:Helix-turn-helix domain-containing protein n=1 Tax=Leekyejoonella antrihumi TaxID=1660198 RepID=A0A563DSX5_9MICO|nr:helix-turn-helix domain-containing protein [Leekyejoonella antrihumi]TWP33042.1 helix-turn-helix domain-containing protein [Leekyejoonella antrihumi]
MVNNDATSGTATGGPRRRRRKKLAPSQKYEIYTSTLTSSATQRELAEQYGVDRTTIRSICATAKQGALDALAAAVPGRRGKSAEQLELDEAHAQIDRLKATICEQAVVLHLEQGKDGWD